MLIPSYAGYAGGIAREYVGGYTFTTGTEAVELTVNFQGNLTGGIGNSAQLGDTIIVALGCRQNPVITLGNNSSSWTLNRTWLEETNQNELSAAVATFKNDFFLQGLTFDFSKAVAPHVCVAVFRGFSNFSTSHAHAAGTGGQPNPPSYSIAAGDWHVATGMASGDNKDFEQQSDFTANDMDGIVTDHTDFAAVGIAWSETNSNAVQFGGGGSGGDSDNNNNWAALALRLEA